MTILKDIFGATDTGLVRKMNQDRFFCRKISETLGYAVLCDGMGGENGGHVASEIATNHAVEALGRELSDGLSELSVRGILLSAVAGANALVYEAAKADGSLAGMGTTMILAVFLRGELFVAYVGDSRVYLVSEGEERQLTKDHTVVQMLVDIGEITQEDAKTHPKRHFITRAVGVASAVEPDYIVEKLYEGDLALLCSDGLYHYLRPGELPALLESCAENHSAGELVALAKAGGGTDNITAVVAAI